MIKSQRRRAPPLREKKTDTRPWPLAGPDRPLDGGGDNAQQGQGGLGSIEGGTVAGLLTDFIGWACGEPDLFLAPVTAHRFFGGPLTESPRWAHCFRCDLAPWCFARVVIGDAD